MTKFKFLKDNTATSKNKFSEVKLVTHKIADKTLEQLEYEGIFIFPELVNGAQDITKEQMILKSNNDCYCTSNIMGFLGYGEERLVIKSRFSTDEQDNFFQYLLEQVLDFPNIVDLNTDASKDNQVISLLLFLFPYYLKTAMRKGVFKTYIGHEYNDNNIKGIIDIARHIRTNTPFVGKIAYNQRKFSYDNQLTELIRHTIEFVKTMSCGKSLLKRVKTEVAAIIQATNDYEFYDRSKVIIANKENPLRHAYYHEYGQLQKLCTMLLEHDKYQIGSGIRQIHGILFDGSWLWEEYVNLLIGDAFYHPMNKSGKGAQELFNKELGHQIGLIYPDFISRNTEQRVIADTKYKPSKNIGNKDYLQVLAYMFRFDAKRGFYLYPEKGNVNDLKLFLNSGSTYESNVAAREGISITKCGLQIPYGVEDYDEFKVAMMQSEEVFKQKILN